MKTTNAPAPRAPKTVSVDYIQRHLRFGWWTLLVFLTFGVLLEAFHGLKAGWYLNVSNETRRLMWTLAHAHGTLLGLLHLAFSFTVYLVPAWPDRSRSLASNSLLAATVLIPGGFFLGGLVIYAGDPGMGILLVPLGALFLFTTVLLTARAASTRPARQ
jgi:hypothetical protein